LETKAGSFWLVLSPSIERGFSGEGQATEWLATSDWKENVDRVINWLGNRSSLDPAEGATQLGLRVHEVNSVFAALAVSGLAGFDASSGYYFQRKLPFLANHIEKFQPRYKNAQRLIDDARVEVLGQSNVDGESLVECSVEGDSCNYFVRLQSRGDTCTCPWFNRYQGNRGSCKHVLAAKLFMRPLHGTKPTKSRADD
jgi:hypothetical protein